MTSKIIKHVDRQASLEELMDEKEMSLSSTTSQVSGQLIKNDEIRASQKARSILEEALSEAREIKEKGRALLTKVEEKSRLKQEEGFKKGQEEGLAQFNEMILAFEKKNGAFVSKLEKEIVSLVYEIGEKILGKELSNHEDSILDLIREALQNAGGQNVIVLVNPEDLVIVRQNQSQLIAAIDASRTLQIRASEKVARHGCLIETEIGTLDAQLETQLAAIKKALGLDDLDEEGESE